MLDSFIKKWKHVVFPQTTPTLKKKQVCHGFPHISVLWRAIARSCYFDDDDDDDIGCLPNDVGNCGSHTL